MFTFSFSTAFAAINYNADNTTALITAAQTELAKAKDNLEDVKDYYLRNYAKGDLNASGVNFTKAAVEVVIEDAFDVFEADIVKAYEEQIVKINGKNLSADTLAAGKTEVAKAIADVYAKYDTKTEITSEIAKITSVMEDILEAQFDIAKAEALATLDQVNYNNYSTTVPDKVTFEDKYLSNQDIAKEVVKDAKEDIEAVKFATTSAPDYINSWFAKKVEYAVKKVDGVYYVYTAYKTSSTLIPTIANEAKEEKTLTEEVAYQKAVVEGTLALQEAAVRKSLNEALETATTNKDTEAVKAINAAIEGLAAKFDALEEQWTFQLEAKETAADAKSLGEAMVKEAGKITVAATTYKDATLELAVSCKAAVAEVTALAAKLTAQTGFDGAPLYNADAIADALEADIEALWFAQAGGRVAAIQANSDLVKAEMARVLGTDAADKVTLSKVVYPAVSGWATYISTNIEADSDYEDEAEAIVTETKAAIRAAKTVADVDAAFVAGYSKLTAVTKESVKTAYHKTDAAKAAKAKYETLLGVAFDSKEAEYGKTQFGKDYDVTKNTLIKALVKEFADAYNAEELEAAYQAGLAEIEGLKTEATLEAEQKAINDAILAIKAPVTAADEAAILALVEQAEDLADYVKMIGATGNYDVYSALLGQYFDAVEDLATDAVDKAVKAIGTTVTVDEADAIAALAAQVAAYEANDYDDKDYTATVADLEAKLLNAQADAVEDAIAAINPAADPLDVAAVEAARAAYDALGEKTIDAVMYAKLLSLENLTAAVKAEEAAAAKAAAIAAIEGLKIKASSTKGKGYIKVKWIVSEEVEGVKYQVYKSTKAHSGYKKSITTSKTTFKNTKNLKKGTRYFYKVRAIGEVDGVTYYSDWSNKANRIAK